MKKLTTRIKSVKPVVPELSTDFSDNILRRIETEEIEIAPVVANGYKKWFRLLTAAISLTLALIAADHMVFELSMNGSLELLYFGKSYLNDFIGYLPLDLILPFLILSGLASWLIWKSRVLKVGLSWLLLGSYLFTTIGGTALAVTGINESIQQAMVEKESNLPWFGPYYRKRARFFIRHRNFQMGRVEKVKNGTAWIVNPLGKELQVQLPPGMEVSVGQYLRLSGETKDAEIFKADRAQFCGSKRAGRYFRQGRMRRQGQGGKSGHHHRRQMRGQQHRGNPDILPDQ